MSWTSFPSWTPALLRRHAVLLVEWLRLANISQRLRSERTWYSLAASVLAPLAAMAAVLGLFSRQLAAGASWLADYWVLTAAVTGIYAANSVARRRRRIHELHLQSWLVAAPIAHATVRASQAIRILFPTAALFLAAASIILLVELITAEVRAVGTAIAAISLGLFIGAFAGWRRGDRLPVRMEASRYVPSKQRGSTQSAIKPGAHALSQLPISQALAWSRPENSRYVLLVALLAVQGGSSAAVGLAVIAMYFVGSYLTGLLAAVLHVGKMASAWLRATPMTLSEFVWVLSHRALMHQVLGTTLAAAFTLLLGAPLWMALQIAALWLGLVMSLTGFALMDAHRGRAPLVKMAVSFVTWMALATALQWRTADKA
jgi:hypothetical protein